jgi:hypothetical protein
MLKKFIAVIDWVGEDQSGHDNLDMDRFRIDHKNSIYLRLQKLNVACQNRKIHIMTIC